jgi:hypothetical protein
MPKFDLDSYETVADRIVKFWQDHPEGRITTKMEHISPDGKQFVVRAVIYREALDELPWATGYAEEHFADRGPNETSPLENCETSAIGRALANAGYATTSESRPSREEMAKVNAHASSAPAPSKVAEVKEGLKPKQSVEGDGQWELIKAGHAADPSNTFLADLVKKGEQYGTLSPKQLGAGANAARKILDAPDKVKDLAAAFPGATVEGYSDEPF